MINANTPESMTTSSQVMETLRRHKVDNEFRWTPEGFTVGKGKVYQPEDLVILKTFRFEGVSDPAYMEILYVIRASDGVMGYSLDAYGTYSSHEDEDGYDNFIRMIPEAGHDQQMPFEL
jgi:hypothetical protein